MSIFLTMRNSLFVIFPWYSSHIPMIFLYTPNIWMIFTSMFPWHFFGRSQTIATPAVQVIAPPRGLGEPWMAAFSWSLGQQRWGMKPTIVGVQWEIRGIIYVFFLGMMWVRYIKLYDQQWGVQSGHDGIACYDRSIEISRYIFMNWNWMHSLIYSMVWLAVRCLKVTMNMLHEGLTMLNGLLFNNRWRGIYLQMWGWNL
jgi:hypothetical protein